MQDHSTIGHFSSESPSELIVACVEPVRKMAYRIAAERSARLEAEELASIGMLAICEVVSRALEKADDPLAYLRQVARQAMFVEYRRVYERSIVSLDAPLSGEMDALTLLDVIAAPSLDLSVPKVGFSSQSRALQKAVLRLTARQRAVIRRYYGLPGYAASPRSEVARQLRVTGASVDAGRRGGVRSLARDRKLRRVLGMEVQ